MARDGYEADLNRLCIYSLETGKKHYLNWKSDVEAFCWSPANGKKMKVTDPQFYFLSVWHGCCNMYTANQKGEVTQLTETWDDWTSIQMANNGQRILATRQSLSTPTDIYMVAPKMKKGTVVNGSADITQLSFENKHILDQLTFGKMQQYWVPTTDGKKELVWVMLPANYEEGKKYPTLLFCEGGPQSPVSQFWSYRWNFQMMAANGYVVVAPNRHGLPGFGQEWKEEISGDWTGQCMDDYLAAIDFAADSLPFVDKNRLGAVGASFGGFSVYYLAGHHNKRFKAFTSVSRLSSLTMVPSTLSPCTQTLRRSSSLTGNTMMPIGTRTAPLVLPRLTRTHLTSLLTSGTPLFSAFMVRKTIVSSTTKEWVPSMQLVCVEFLQSCSSSLTRTTGY